MAKNRTDTSLPSPESLEADERELYDEEGTNTREEKEEDEDTSCCPGATCCNARLRDISVHEAVSSCLGERVTWSCLFWLASCITIIAMTWSTLYFLIGEPMLPNGKIFGLFFLVIASYTLGWSLAYVPYFNIPPVFGMLLAGIIFRNTGLYNIQAQIGTAATSKIRTFCLTFVTLRAGLQLTTTPIQRHPIFLMAFAVLPCTLEMLVVGFCARWILDYPWDWAFLTGSIIACMSPVVTVNCILALADRGYGEDKGIATLLCIAASIDNVLIVSLFSVCFSFLFSKDATRTEWWSYIPGGLRDIILGLIAGLILGTVFVFIPHRTAKYVTLYRLLSLILGALMCTTAASKIAVTGGGFLAAVFMSFIATTGWRLSTRKFDVAPLRHAVFFVWHFMQPVLVGVIGADIDFANWSASRFGLYVLTILIGLLARSIAAIVVTYRTPFNIKERIFFALAWLPKGTLQAALAPMAYEHAKMDKDPEKIEFALDVVRISVVAIIFLAPLGAVIMMISGPLLLNKITGEEAQRQRYLSYLAMVNQLQPVRTQPRKIQAVRRTSA